LYSLEVMKSLRGLLTGEFAHARRGTLRVFRTLKGLDNAVAAAEKWIPEGLPFRKLSATQLGALEPALGPIICRLAGAIHYEIDESGDARRFCEVLAEEAQRQGVAFHFGTEIASLRMRSNSVVAAVGATDEFTADEYIVAAGSHAPLLLRSVGVRIPVQPVKGYSITIERPRGPHPLQIPVLDDDLHAAVTPLGASIRVAGTAEFAGYDRSPNPVRTENLVRLLRAILPEVQYDASAMSRWCGLRPVCADGVPIIGRTRISNLLLNTGHGPLGWTLAAGSAQLLVHMITGVSPAIATTPYSLARFETNPK
jgi:D-amino-acid dehydrogenase